MSQNSQQRCDAYFEFVEKNWGIVIYASLIVLVPVFQFLTGCSANWSDR